MQKYFQFQSDHLLQKDKFQIMNQPQTDLLSLLEKVWNPLQSLTVNIKLSGVYAPPEQWKVTDEINPNLFTYELELLNDKFANGKIQPRKLTEKQLKELEDKSKKGSKKESKDNKEQKEQEKLPEIDPEEQLRKQREWDALSEQQKFHRTQEDPYKAFFLIFPQQQKQLAFDSETVGQIQSKLDGAAVEIVLVRKLALPEDQLAKYKKSKPKNINLGELYTANYKGTLDTTQLLKPGSTLISQRVKLTFDGVLPDDGVKIETDVCYAYIQLQLSDPINPKVEQISPKTSEVIPDFPKPKSQQNCHPVVNLKAELCRSIRAISQEYITCFSKQKEHQQERRHTNLSNISTLRLNEITKKKETFLNEFISSGKFSLLKDRISSSVKEVIIDKFRKQKIGSEIAKKEINIILSELSLFFQEEFIRTIDEFLATDSSTIHEDLVLGYQFSRQSRKVLVAPIINETEIQRQQRLAWEYETLQKQYGEGCLYKAEEHYLNILLLANKSLESSQNYAKFCLKGQKFNEAFILYSQIADKSKSLEHKLTCAALLVHRKRIEETLSLVSSMMNDPASTITHKIHYNLLLSFMYEREADIKNSEKYLAIAERYYKMKKSPFMKFIPTQNPYELPRPAVPKPQRYVSQLTQSQSQQIRNSFISILSELNLYSLVEEYLPKLDNSIRKSILEMQVNVFNKNYDRALEIVNFLLRQGDNGENIEILLFKAEICYQSDRMFECEEIFLKILNLNPAPSISIQVYLRLGQTYLSRKSWQDSKQVFQKAVEHKYNCSVGWIGLGISNLNLGLINDAQQALNLFKIYNPLSEDAQQYQTLVQEQHRAKNGSN